VIARPAGLERQHYVVDPNARFYRITRNQPQQTGPGPQAMSKTRTSSVEGEKTAYGMAACGDAVDIAEVVRTRAGRATHDAPRDWRA
jgi:hypothetical protein